MNEHFEKLKTILRSYGRVAIAFSAGVDSTFLLRIALDELSSENVLALTLDTPLFPRSELELSRKLAQQFGAEQALIEFNPFSIEEFRQNTKQRCYFCKRAMFGALKSAASERNFAILADGSNFDDLASYRPGKMAIAELGIESPLEKCGLTKNEIRQLSRELSLSTWNLPSVPCLATRFPYDTELTLTKINRVEHGEKVLQEHGLNNFRLRDHGDLARLEVLPEQFELLLRERLTIIERLRTLGYEHIALDLAGYRSGSFDYNLNKKQ